MYKAKALDGERAGEFVFAKEHGLTHELCQQWKLVCPECRQFLYFNESKEPEIRRSWFSHPDNEDKNCPERNSSIKGKANQGFLGKSHEQDLEAAEAFIEQVFYGIDPEYFQKQSTKETEDDSYLLTSGVKWFQENFQHECNNWIKHYCRETGFLDWKNPDREIGYLMDWLNVLSRREDVLKHVICYFVFIYSSSNFEIDSICSKFGCSEPDEKEELLICLIALDKIIEQLFALANGELPNRKFRVFSPKAFMNIQIPANKSKISFTARRRTIPKGYFEATCWGHKPEGFDNQDEMPVWVGKDLILFKKEPIDHFICVTGEDLDNNRDVLLNEELLSLCMDQGGNLFVRGFAEKRRHKAIARGISKVLFNRSNYSILILLRYGFISNAIAEKSAQLALKFEYGDLSPSKALEKFNSLSDPLGRLKLFPRLGEGKQT